MPPPPPPPPHLASSQEFTYNGLDLRVYSNQKSLAKRRLNIAYAAAPTEVRCIRVYDLVDLESMGTHDSVREMAATSRPRRVPRRRSFRVTFGDRGKTGRRGGFLWIGRICRWVGRKRLRSGGGSGFGFGSAPGAHLR